MSAALLRRALAERLARTAGRWPKSMFGADENAERLARAHALGFDTDVTLYHGTRDDIDALRPADQAAWGDGVYLSRDPSRASSFASIYGGDTESAGANVVPVFVRRGAALPSRLRASDVRVRDPRDIRSIFAAFDPEQAGSADLLAGLAVAAPVGALTLREALLRQMTEEV